MKVQSIMFGISGRTVACMLVLFITAIIQGCNRPHLSSNGGGAGACSPPSEYTLAAPNTVSQVKQIGQEQEQWCWAASGEMVLAYYGQQVSQCKQVSDRYPRIGNCCAHNPPAGCATETGWPQFCKHNLDLKIKHKAGLKWEELEEQIGCQKSPVAFTWRWADGVHGHMMVAFGYGTDSQNASRPFLWVRNPLPISTGKTEKIFYADYLPDSSSSGNSVEPIHTHWDDFYDFQSKQSVACTNDNSE
jgi:hypothetical protein